ncbi:MAG: VWA domain-containing protein [Gammaproteobacteria bacterium]|nr:VWA domain-containing protein [Gammaproteobacteria bacterium]
MKRVIIIAASLAIAALIGGCNGEAKPNNRGVYLLIDTSGTYAQELEKAQQLINVILVRLEPGDSFAVGRIDTGSFSEKDIIAKMTFDDRPSVANKQKRQFREMINQFVRQVRPAQHTDITGGVLQAIEYLNEKNTGNKDVLIYSDLEEDLPKGYIRDIPLQLAGFSVTALNVTKLRADNVDPRKYLTRLEDWQTRVEEGGGRWSVVNDMDRLERILIN